MIYKQLQLCPYIIFLGKLHFIQILLSASCLFCVLGFFMSEMNLVHLEPVVPSSFSLLPAKIIHVLGLHVFLCLDFPILPAEKKCSLLP